ncbi:MAG: DUF4760 domain-containing protein [Candidatus Nealsonbacteria bacterium]|nr:DUF4760 domain-containing protein [Candidatus Nealsonbacteria bacterium]
MTLTNIILIGCICSFAALLVLFVFVCLFVRRIWRLLSVSFVKGELNEAKEARVLLRMMDEKNQSILEFLGKEPDPAAVQSFLQLVYAFNRIAAGIRKGYLSQIAIFLIWEPAWFLQKWLDLRPLIIQERERRRNKKLYEDFEWLAKERCTRVQIIK